MENGDEKKDHKKKLSNAKLLALAEKRKEKVETIREDDPDSARKIEAKDAWKKALDKAKGVQVKDDPKVLKKV